MQQIETKLSRTASQGGSGGSEALDRRVATALADNAPVTPQRNEPDKPVVERVSQRRA